MLAPEDRPIERQQVFELAVDPDNILSVDDSIPSRQDLLSQRKLHGECCPCRSALLLIRLEVPWQRLRFSVHRQPSGPLLGRHRAESINTDEVTAGKTGRRDF